MKITFSIYRLVTVLLLSSLLLSAYIWKELHYIVGYCHLAEVSCNHDHDSDNAHFHNVHCEDGDCNICQFHYSPSEKFDSKLKIYQPELIFSVLHPIKEAPIAIAWSYLPTLRAPPVL